MLIVSLTTLLFFIYARFPCVIGCDLRGLKVIHSFNITPVMRCSQVIHSLLCRIALALKYDFHISACVRIG